MNNKDLNAYKVIEERFLKDVNSNATILEHNKTKAKVVCIECDDENKVFAIGFRTPPKDDTGVCHIIEHTVLCGSKKYPAKDPFIELVKGSLNTFLNAMTYPDKTLYPVASCNDQDFKNLMDVYMDAVFNPNIVKIENIFKQEGWHYELNDSNEELTINGVVYNEMKGAFSSPDGVLERAIMHNLFPDNSYGFESGGDPEAIPNLTYENYIDFYKEFYHPSNSYIYLYGDMDMVERLNYIDKEYLGKYDYLKVDSEIKKQSGFDEIKRVRMTYPITDTESEEDNTTLSLNFVVGEAGDEKLGTAMQIIDYALMGQGGAPLKQALLDKGIGKDVSGSYEGGLLQPYYSITSEMANEEQAELFYSTIMDTLKDIVKTGIDKESLRASINNMDFNYREMDFGRFPKGLMFGIKVFDNWLYDKDPFLAFEGSKIFEELRANINTDYYERIVEEYIINNKHGVLVVNAPVKGLAKEKEEKLKEKLKAIKDGMSSDEIDELIDNTKNLLEYQTTPSPKEEIEKIPMLKISDIKEEAMDFLNEVSYCEGVKVYSHDYESNRISYFDLIFDVSDMPYELIPYAGILKYLLTSISTEKYTYQELSNEIMMNMGELSFTTGNMLTSADGKEYINTFEAHVKCFDEQVSKAFELLEETMLKSIFADKNRIKELIGELKSKIMYRFMSNGNRVAGIRASSYYSKKSYEEDLRSGISFYKTVEELEKNFDLQVDELIEKLQKCVGYNFRKNNLIVNYTHKKGDEEFANSLKEFIGKLPDKEINYEKPVFVGEKKNEAFVTSSQVQYVCQSGMFEDEFDDGLRVLRTILDYEYLWNNIRVTGGAYGCGASFSKSCECAFHTYRDPNLKRSLEVFKNIPDWVREFDCSDRDMTKYIIGTFSGIDSPMSVQAKGLVAMSLALRNITTEERTQVRKKILKTDVNAIRAMAPKLEEAISKEYICVVGSQSKIEEDADVFKNILNLFE